MSRRGKLALAATGLASAVLSAVIIWTATLRLTPRQQPGSLMVKPVQPEVQALPGDNIHFEFEAGPASGLPYTWTVDGRPVARGETYRFEARDPGTVEVAVAAETADGERIRRTWKVSVHPVADVRPRQRLMALLDQVLDRLDLATVAFNAPELLHMGDSSVIQLLLSTKRPIQ